MADIDIKALTPAAAAAASVIMGAASTAAASPSLFTSVGAGSVLLTNSGTTITANAPALDLGQTWNAGGVTFTGLKFNVTDTASAAASLLLDLQVGGVSKLSINKGGTINFFNGLFIGSDDGTSGAVYSRADNTGSSALFGGGAYNTGAGITVAGNAAAARTSRTTFWRNGWWVNAQFDENGNFIQAGNKTIGFSSSGDTQITLAAVDIYLQRVGAGILRVAGGTNPSIQLSTDVTLYRAAAASLQLGAADAAAPVAQTLGVQSVVAGTSNGAGANFTINGSRGTGTGAGGSIIFQVAPAGTTGTAQNAYATALTITSGLALQAASTGSLGFSTDVILTRAAAATLQLGAADAAAPVAQGLRVQSVVAGTTNTAGQNFTIRGSVGTGTGAGGSIIFQTAPAGSTGTAQNTAIDALTVTAVNTGTLLSVVNSSSTTVFTVSDAGTVVATGGLTLAYVSKTADYTLTANDYCVKCITNAFTATLPSAVTMGAGKIFVVKNLNTTASLNNITIQTTSSQTIDGYAAPGYLTPGQSMTLMSDGANWMVI